MRASRFVASILAATCLFGWWSTAYSNDQLGSVGQNMMMSQFRCC